VLTTLSQAGDADDTATGRGTSPASRPRRAAAPHDPPDPAHRRAVGRHVHHPRRQRLPVAVEVALLSVEGTLPHYQIVLTEQQILDEMEVQVEVTKEAFSDKVGALEQCGRSWAGPGVHAGRALQSQLVEPQTHSAQPGQGEAPSSTTA